MLRAISVSKETWNKASKLADCVEKTIEEYLEDLLDEVVSEEYEDEFGEDNAVLSKKKPKKYTASIECEDDEGNPCDPREDLDDVEVVKVVSKKDRELFLFALKNGRLAPTGGVSSAPGKLTKPRACKIEEILFRNKKLKTAPKRLTVGRWVDFVVSKDGGVVPMPLCDKWADVYDALYHEGMFQD